MNERIKTLWTAALTSGTYEQVHGRLHKTPGFCALGVLCDLHQLETHADHWRGPDGRGDFYYLGNPYYLPQAVEDWAGLPEEPAINIIALDQQGLSFAEIARAIEAQL